MGVYNPHIPYILGQEWVPIREENFQFQPDVVSREVGYGFTLLSSQQLNNSRLYVHKLPPQAINIHSPLVNIYPAGREALTGPIKKVIIPINDSAGITGSHGSLSGGATSVADALFSPADFKSALATSSPGPAALSLQFNAYFAVNDYAPSLVGKRILNVSLIYTGYANMTDDAGKPVAFQRKPDPNGINSSLVYVNNTSGVQVTYAAEPYAELGALNGFSDFAPDPSNGGGAASAQTYGRLNLGDVAACLGTTSNVRTPWTFEQLRRFDLRNGLSCQLLVVFNVPLANVEAFPTSGAFVLNYMAMEVTYCEETRIALGTTDLLYSQGINVVNMTDLNLGANPIIAAGNYTATLSFVNPGDIAFSGSQLNGPFAEINALREKYSLPTMPGVEVDIPSPVFDREGETFTRVSTSVIPQLTLHASGGPLLDPHVYGRQAVAQVYGNITASQNVLDSVIGGNTSFPWVRFYARRFGKTTQPLVLSSASAPVSGLGVSISPAQWDALPEVLDGWKEVTLRFNTSPVMGSGFSPTWTWSATGELAGNRWEVLGASAPAISGTVQSPYNNPGPTSAQLSSATYGQPSSGSSINLQWMPGITPPVSGSTADPTSDAVLIFSQDPVAITGMSVAAQNQTLIGIALDCNTFPWYVPTAMNYNKVAWSATSSSVPLSGFSYYELQRQDTINPTWQTIAKVQDPFGTLLPVIKDTFTRDFVNGWGTPDVGPAAWTTQQGSPSEYFVTDGKGQINLAGLGLSRFVFINGSSTDVDITGETTCSVTLRGGTVNTFLCLRFIDTSNYYGLNVNFLTNGTASLIIQRVNTAIATASITLPYGPGTVISSRFRAVGQNLYGRFWLTGTPEPEIWHVTTTDATYASGGFMVRVIADGGVTNPLPINFTFDNIVASTLAPVFNDYEARLGVVSSYRVRAVNELLFPGPWSSTVTNTLVSPGVTGTGISSASRVLLFTSNYRQDGSRNLAYALGFEGDTTEQFQFPEAGFTQYQFMYNRDYQTAFRPLERGGAVFSRTVLVQAAAIPPPTLADFTSLRDMAWDTLPYVCVRDEDGNRWFANVTVPDGRVKMNNRELYLADIQVVEVTATPAVITA